MSGPIPSTARQQVPVNRTTLPVPAMIDEHDADTTLTRAGHGYRATLVSQAVRVGCKAAAVVVLARLVSPADHGRYAMAASVFFVLVLFRDFGLGTVAIQSSTLSEPERSTLWRAHVVLGVLLAIVSLAAAPFVARFYHEPRVVGLLGLMSAGFILLGINAWPRVLLARDLRFAELNRVETGAAVLGTCAMIAAAALRAGAYAFVVFLLVSETVHAIGAWRVCPWRARAAADWSTLRALGAAGLHLTGYNVLAALLQQLDSILMGRWFGPGALGLYNRPSQLLALPNQHLAAPLTQVLLATLSRLGRNSAEWAHHVRATANMIAHLTLPAAAICIAVPDEIVGVVLGAAWPAAAPLLRWLAVGAAASYLGSTSYGVCIASGHTRRLVGIGVMTLATLLAALAFARHHGPRGLAAAVGLTNAVLLLPRLGWTVRGTPVRLRHYVRAFAGPVITALALGGGAKLGATGTAHLALLPRLAAAGCSGLAAAGIVAALSDTIRAELRLLWQRLPFSAAPRPAGSP